MNDMNEPAGLEKPRGVSRRTVAKGVAWAVPAITLATATPAFAASGNPPEIVAGQAFKWPGESCPEAPPGLDATKAYLFTFRVTNNTSKPIYIYVDGSSITTDAGITFSLVATTPAQGTPLAPGDSMDLRVWANSSNSGNLTFNATATIAWGHNYPPPDPTGHPPVVLQWHVPGTPTTESAGYAKCQVPPFVPLA